MSTPDRETVLADLEAMVAWLRANPGIPLPRYTDISFHLYGSDGEKRAQVDAIAAITSEAPQSAAGGDHYMVTKAFGTASYRAVAITSAHMARYYALHSYDGSVEPGTGGQE